jgi:hypothetical protein
VADERDGRHRGVLAVTVNADFADLEGCGEFVQVVFVAAGALTGRGAYA